MTGGCAMSRDECAAAARCDASARRAPSGALWKQLCMSTVLLALAAIACSCLRTRRTAAACVVLLSVAAQLQGAGAQLSPRDIAPPTVPDKGVCGSVDIRNNVKEFSQLTGCRVVEGFVRILLIEGAEESAYHEFEFPELTEITGYLLLYRASGLHSLAKLFPNLTVIRGNSLMLNYALVSFEMMNLRELGLHSLREIVRGGVRFEKNPKLCFVDTIDWGLIAPKGVELHYIKGNRETNECPMCPNDCPKTPSAMGLLNGLANQPLCWNSHHCQAMCPSVCEGGCDPSGKCCHENCLGGCSESPGPEPSPNVCTACRAVQHNNKCIKRCPVGTYQYLQRRCVSEAECYAMPMPVESNMPERNTTWKPFNETECILDCPPGTEEKWLNNRLICGVCSGQCRRECHGHSVDSISSAQRLRGCTHINGALEIQVTGGKNVVKELEENLNLIEEIDGYLKVVRSFPLISLGFLRSLRVIHGNILESNRHALVVIDNQNLQELWDWNTRGKLEIRNGRLSFHFNPKLCLREISRLNQIANLSKYTELEVAPNSNGDKVTCNVTELNAWIKSTQPYGAVISWDKFEHYDERLLLGYVVYSIEAPFNNLTLYDGRDACGTDGWIVDDALPGETNQILSQLKPYTQYAFYVKTYMISGEDSGAQSAIKYFMTKPSVPSVPQALKVFANSSTELVIMWQPPLTPNGNVTYYIVTGEKDNDDNAFLGERNYCRDPVLPMEKKAQRVTEAPGAASTTPSCACEEKGDKTSKQEEIDQKLLSIHFEDSLQNIVYIKNPLQQRSRREVSALMSRNHSESNKFRRVVRSNMAVVTGLRHYSQYTVTVRACRELTKDEAAMGNFNESNCSQTSLESARTLPLSGADNVSHVAVGSANHSLGAVRLAWEEPARPNGLVVAYHIEYRRLDIEHHKPTEECITRKQYEDFGRSYSLKHLAPGNYSVSVRATSLAGNGNFAPAAIFQIRVDSDTSAVGWIIGGTFAVVAIAVIGIGAFLYVRHRYLGGGAMKLIASVNPEYMSTVYVPDEWEVPRKKVELLRELGQGSFGMVYEGVVKDLPMLPDPATRCAVKTVGEHASDRERSEFLNEASVMKAFHTHHVVQLLGVVSLGQPVLVVMELMTHGDLKTYLRSHRPDTGGDPTVLPPSLSRVLRMAAEIADGMAYLAAKKFVHRDLAARNCMVADDLTVKIGDFGMTRDIYETDYYRKGTKGLLPVRWMAPESLKDGVFTSRSDVWSYGVVLWEMATLASQPYQGLSNDQVLRYVIDGGVMERPDNCPERLSQLMERCWQHRPMARPSFLSLVSTLLPDLADADAFQLVSFYHTPEAAELRAPAAIGPDDIDLGSDDEFPPREPLLGEPLLGEANGSAGPKLVGNGCTTPTSLQTTAC